MQKTRIGNSDCTEVHYCVWVSIAKRVAYSAFLTHVRERRLSYPQVYNIGAAVYCHLVNGSGPSQ